MRPKSKIKASINAVISPRCQLLLVIFHICCWWIARWKRCTHIREALVKYICKNHANFSVSAPKNQSDWISRGWLSSTGFWLATVGQDRCQFCKIVFLLGNIVSIFLTHPGWIFQYKKKKSVCQVYHHSQRYFPPNLFVFSLYTCCQKYVPFVNKSVSYIRVKPFAAFAYRFLAKRNVNPAESGIKLQTV